MSAAPHNPVVLSGLLQKKSRTGIKAAGKWTDKYVVLSRAHPPCMIYWTLYPDSSVDTITSLPPHGLIPIHHVLNVRALLKDGACRFQLDVRFTAQKFVQINHQHTGPADQDHIEIYQFKAQTSQDAARWVREIAVLFAFTQKQQFTKDLSQTKPQSTQAQVQFAEFVHLPKSTPAIEKRVAFSADSVLEFMPNLIIIVNDDHFGRSFYISEFAADLKTLPLMLRWLLQILSADLCRYVNQLKQCECFNLPIRSQSAKRLQRSYLELNRTVFLEVLRDEGVGVELRLALVFLYLYGFHKISLCSHSIQTCERCSVVWKYFHDMISHGLKSSPDLTGRVLCFLVGARGLTDGDYDNDPFRVELFFMLVSSVPLFSEFDSISEIVHTMLSCTVSNPENVVRIINYNANWQIDFLNVIIRCTSSAQDFQMNFVAWTEDDESLFFYAVSAFSQVLYTQFFSSQTFTQELRNLPRTFCQFSIQGIIGHQLGVRLFNFLLFVLLDRLVNAAFKFPDTRDDTQWHVYDNLVQLTQQVLYFQSKKARAWADTLQDIGRSVMEQADGVQILLNFSPSSFLVPKLALLFERLHLQERCKGAETEIEKKLLQSMDDINKVLAEYKT